jgi:CheY-like chemotaxis protein
MQQENAPNRNTICVILYVEDSDAMAYLFQRALEHNGTDVRLFRVADGNLPKKSGFEVLEEIGRSDALKELPVVVFSSSSRTQIACARWR